MCDLCDSNTREKDAAILRSRANDLRILANSLDALADGKQKPHSDISALVGNRARNIIRYLVEEWM